MTDDLVHGTTPAADARARTEAATGTERPTLPGPAIHPLRRAFRYYLARAAATLLVRAYLRLSIEGSGKLPRGPALLCFNHLNWADPFILMACLPWRPRLYFFGPREEDMGRGVRNRLMRWVGTSVAYKPAKTDLLDVTRRVTTVFRAGGVIAIAGEGRIHVGEAIVLPLNEGAAYFAIRANVPIVPVAISGTSWLALGRQVRVRVGDPIRPDGRPTRERIASLSDETRAALAALVADREERPAPGPFGRWLTELFNEWPAGVRPDASEPVEPAVPSGIEPPRL